MASYIGIIHKDQDSDFGVSFPDFPGCISAGSSLDEAGRMAGEALDFHIRGMEEDGEAIPVPMSLEEAQAHEFAQGAVAFIVVRVPDQEGRTVRVNITLKDSELSAIDAAAAQARMSRSGFLVSRALGQGRPLDLDRGNGRL